MISLVHETFQGCLSCMCTTWIGVKMNNKITQNCLPISFLDFYHCFSQNNNKKSKV